MPGVVASAFGVSCFGGLAFDVSSFGIFAFDVSSFGVFSFGSFAFEGFTVVVLVDSVFAAESRELGAVGEDSGAGEDALGSKGNNVHWGRVDDGVKVDEWVKRDEGVKAVENWKVVEGVGVGERLKGGN